MAFSVSSEHAFSSTGITISKQWNRLKVNIVEALQCLKCLYHHDLLFCEVIHPSSIEAELDSIEIVDIDIDFQEAFSQAEEFSWSDLLVDEEDNEDPVV